MAEDNNKGRPDGLPLNGNTDELADRLIIKNDASFSNKTHIGTLPAKPKDAFVDADGKTF